MALVIDQELKRLIDALYNGPDYDPLDDLDPQPWERDDVELDPVARITEERTTTPTTIPVAEKEEPFSERTFDLATNTRKEQRIADKTFAGSTVGSPGSFQAAEAKFKQPVKTGLTNEQFVKRMLAKEGMDYEWGGTTKKGGFDCSGIIWRIMTKAGHTVYPRHSSAIYEHSKKIPLKKAIKTRGAILYTPGHIAISLGNGKTIEAKGEDYGVVSDTAYGRFKYGGLLPELSYIKGKPRKRVLKNALKGAQGERVRHAVTPGLNNLSSVDPLVTATTVFGTIQAEVAEPPRSKVRNQTEDNIKTGGLKFAPARFRKLFHQAADRYGISARLLAAIAQHESNFDPKAVSSAGAQGVMQIMPLHGLEDPFDPKNNIFKGAEIFARYLQAADGDVRKALAFYNAGPNADPDLIAERMRVYADPIIDLWKGR